jgi:hypothetical protein
MSIPIAYPVTQALKRCILGLLQADFTHEFIHADKAPFVTAETDGEDTHDATSS